MILDRTFKIKIELGEIYLVLSANNEKAALKIAKEIISEEFSDDFEKKVKYQIEKDKNDK